MCSFKIIVFISFMCVIVACADQNKKEKKCKIPPVAPQQIQKVISQCQDEIKLAIISEALSVLHESDHAKNRAKRQAFTDDERRIAGCLLQCVYRKMKAVNENGFPTLEGLVGIYSEGVTDKDYFVATVQAVSSCLNAAQKKHLITPNAIKEHGKTCDIAYDVFDCVSDEIGEYCGGQTP